MPDSPTLSERLRKALGNYSDTSAWLRLNGAEILQALDDNERMKAEREQAVEYLSKLLVHCYPEIDVLPTLLGLCTQVDNGLAVGLMQEREALQSLRVENLRSGKAGINALHADNMALESDNERYRATIVQLEKERAEAVERVRQMEQIGLGMDEDQS